MSSVEELSIPFGYLHGRRSDISNTCLPTKAGMGGFGEGLSPSSMPAHIQASLQCLCTCIEKENISILASPLLRRRHTGGTLHTFVFGCLLGEASFWGGYPHCTWEAAGMAFPSLLSLSSSFSSPKQKPFLPLSDDCCTPGLSLPPALCSRHFVLPAVWGGILIPLSCELT